MSVDTWEPAAGAGPNDLDIRRLCQASRALDEPDFGLSTHEIARLAAFARHEGAVDWSALAEPMADAAIEQLIRLFTLAESAFPAWEAGAHSPVVPLVAALKQRERYPAELTGWIKKHSDNRFLPYGSLMDRL